MPNIYSNLEVLLERLFFDDSDNFEAEAELNSDNEEEDNNFCSLLSSYDPDITFEGDHEDKKYKDQLKYPYSDDYDEEDYNYGNLKTKKSGKQYFTTSAKWDKEKMRSNIDEVEAEFKDFWALHSETIILNSWTQKYKDCPGYHQYNMEISKNCPQNIKLENKTIISGNYTSENVNEMDDQLSNISEIRTSMSFADSTNVDRETKDSKTSFTPNDIGTKIKTSNKDGDLKKNYYENCHSNSNFKCEEEFRQSKVMGTNAIEKDFENSSEMVDPELLEIMKSYPSSFVKREYNNMFSLKVDSTSKSGVETSKSDSVLWDELWASHSQEQYDFHHKLFMEFKLKHSESGTISEEDSDVLKCNFCGKYNCVICNTNDFENDVYKCNIYDDHVYGLTGYLKM